MTTTRLMRPSGTPSRARSESIRHYSPSEADEFEGIELSTRRSLPLTTRQVSNQSQNVEREQPGLPAADRGLQAWMVLAASSLVQVPVWGERSLCLLSFYFQHTVNMEEVLITPM
jgi:hypothetical protein